MVSSRGSDVYFSVVEQLGCRKKEERKKKGGCRESVEYLYIILALILILCGFIHEKERVTRTL